MTRPVDDGRCRARYLAADRLASKSVEPRYILFAVLVIALDVLKVEMYGEEQNRLGVIESGRLFIGSSELEKESKRQTGLQSLEIEFLCP